MTPCDGIHWHQYMTLLHVLILWCRARTGDGWSPNELCGGEQSHAYIINTNWNTIDSLWWNTLTSGTVTLLLVFDSVSARAAQLGTDVQNELCEGEQSHAYIIKHPIETQLTPCMEYTDIRYSDITTCIAFCQCQSSTTGGQMVSKWICVRESSLIAYNQAPNETQLTPCDGIHCIRYSDITTCIDSVSAREPTETDGIQMNCVRESSLMLT